MGAGRSDSKTLPAPRNSRAVQWGVLCIRTVCREAAESPGAKGGYWSPNCQGSDLCPLVEAVLRLTSFALACFSVDFCAPLRDCPVRAVVAGSGTLAQGFSIRRACRRLEVATGSPLLLMMIRCKSRPVHAHLRVTDDQARKGGRPAFGTPPAHGFSRTESLPQLCWAVAGCPWDRPRFLV